MVPQPRIELKIQHYKSRVLPLNYWGLKLHFGENINKEDLEKYIEMGLSIRDISKETKKSFTTVKYHLNKLNLKTKHCRKPQTKTCIFCGNLISNKKKYCNNKCQQDNTTKLNIDRWLLTGMIDSASVPGYSRKYILQEQDNKCSICFIEQIWNGKSLVFVADHIDGNSTNNNRDNLRLVCPNCDSQLPTFKSRNKGKGRFNRRMRYKDGKSY